MVAARGTFLAGHHFLPLAENIAEACRKHGAGARFTVEVGAGTGYYIAHALGALPLSTGLAVDLSKYAARRAAQAHLRLDAIVADILERLPLRSDSFDLALDIFAPRPASELHRILNRDGRLIVAFPAQHHLTELRGSIEMLAVDPKKEWRISRTLAPFFRLLDTQLCQWEMQLSHEQLAALVFMGPSARHLDASTVLGRIGGLDSPLRVTCAVNIHVYETCKACDAD